MVRPSLKESVARERKRRERGKRERRFVIGRYLATAGAIGWLVIVPTLLGAWAGRALDRWFDTGVVFSGAMLALGLALGCYLGWNILRAEWRKPWS